MVSGYIKKQKEKDGGEEEKVENKTTYWTRLDFGNTTGAAETELGGKELL